RRHTRSKRDWSSDVCSSDLNINMNKQKAESDQLPKKKLTNTKIIIVGAIIMVLTQIIMLAIMTMTPVHMESHGHSLGAVGLVIRSEERRVGTEGGSRWSRDA